RCVRGDVLPGILVCHPGARAVGRGRADSGAEGGAGCGLFGPRASAWPRRDDLAGAASPARSPRPIVQDLTSRSWALPRRSRGTGYAVSVLVAGGGAAGVETRRGGG